VAAYLVPQVMAYAVLAGLPPVAGLWAILAPLALYAFLGSSRQLSLGPESTTALMTAAVVAPLAGGDPARHVVLADDRRSTRQTHGIAIHGDSVHPQGNFVRPPVERNRGRQRGNLLAAYWEIHLAVGIRGRNRQLQRAEGSRVPC